MCISPKDHPQPWIQDVSKVTLGAQWSVEEEVEVTGDEVCLSPWSDTASAAKP